MVLNKSSNELHFVKKNLVSLCGSIHWLLVLSCFVISSWVLFICHNYDDIIKVFLFLFFFLGLNEKQKQNKSTMQCHHGMNDCRHVSFRCRGLNVTVITIIFSLLIRNFCLTSQSQPHRFVNVNIKRLWEHFSKFSNCESVR